MNLHSNTSRCIAQIFAFGQFVAMHQQVTNGGMRQISDIFDRKKMAAFLENGRSTHFMYLDLQDLIQDFTGEISKLDIQFDKAVQYDLMIADHANHFSMLENRCDTEAEVVKQAGAISNIEIRFNPRLPALT